MTKTRRAHGGQCLAVLMFAMIATLGAVRAVAQVTTGRVEGRIIRAEGTEGGALVVMGSAATVGDADGAFAIDLPPGRHALACAHTPDRARLTVDILAGTTRQVGEIDCRVTYLVLVEVTAVSGLPEQPSASPAPAAIVANDSMAAASGQLPQLLQAVPGAFVTQGGLWDFNVGTRGFNRALSRRVAVLVDGRDASLPFFGYQGWAAFSFPLDDLVVEFDRGPGAALYGPNASGGVIAVRSRPPEEDGARLVRFMTGGLGTVQFDGKWAGPIAERWSARFVGGIRRSRGFARSRVEGPEYSIPCPLAGLGDCLPQEFIAIDGEDTEIYYGGARLDWRPDDRTRLVFEGGHAQGSFGVFQGMGQRTKSTARDGRRPWARMVVSRDGTKDPRPGDTAADPDARGAKGWDASISYDGYQEPTGYIGLSTGAMLPSSSHRVHAEGVTRTSAWAGRVRLRGGAAATVERMTSVDKTGAQSFLFAPVSSDAEAVFGSARWQLTDRLIAHVAGRGDWSSLHTFQPSVRTAINYEFAPDQWIRVAHNRAFQVANSLEYFLRAPVAPPVDLSGLNAGCRQFGVDCGLGLTPVLALGNPDMAVERVRSVELGYAGSLGPRARVTIDAYRSTSTDVVTSLLPQLGTGLGRINPRFAAWRPPPGVPEPIAEAIRAALPQLSNDADGATIIAAASYTNFHRARVDGIDLTVDYQIDRRWRTGVGYSRFGFHHSDRRAEGLLLPNTPPHTLTAGLQYDNAEAGTAARATLRWVDGFRWADGYFQGDVEPYTVVDVSATFKLATGLSATVAVSNLFDDAHWETFGGALIGRRALAGLQYDWTRRAIR